MKSPVKLWRNQKKIHDLIGKSGKVVSWTLVWVPPAGFADQAPYISALIDIEGGKRIMAQLVDVREGQVKIGLKVTTVVRRVTQPSEDGIIPYGIKVRPQSL
jgi:hypothetical protein